MSLFDLISTCLLSFLSLCLPCSSVQWTEHNDCEAQAHIFIPILYTEGQSQQKL